MVNFVFGLKLGGDTSEQLRKVFHHAELLNSTQRPAEIEIKSLNLQELMTFSSEYMTYEGSLTWPGCFESVTWIIFNKYQQILSTYLQTFTNALRIVNNRRTLMANTSVHRNVRTNIGSEQWFRPSISESSTCYPVNNILQYHGNFKYF